MVGSLITTHDTTGLTLNGPVTPRRVPIGAKWSNTSFSFVNAQGAGTGSLEVDLVDLRGRR